MVTTFNVRVLSSLGAEMATNDFDCKITIIFSIFDALKNQYFLLVGENFRAYLFGKKLSDFYIPSNMF
jgi:hypothetical protein